MNTPETNDAQDEAKAAAIARLKDIIESEHDEDGDYVRNTVRRDIATLLALTAAEKPDAPVHPLTKALNDIEKLKPEALTGETPRSELEYIAQLERELTAERAEAGKRQALTDYWANRAELAEMTEAQLRAEADRLRKNIGCARNQGTTQFCHEAVDAKAEAERLRAELAIERNKAIGNALAAESRDILAAENAKLRAVVAGVRTAWDAHLGPHKADVDGVDKFLCVVDQLLISQTHRGTAEEGVASTEDDRHPQDDPRDQEDREGGKHY